MLLHTAPFWNIIIQWTSHDDLTEKSAFISQYSDPKEKTCQMTEIQNFTLRLTEKLLLLNFVSMQFLTEISNQSGSQIHSWILLKKNLLCQNLFYFFRASPFHSEWLPLINILRIETFPPKANQNLSRLWPIEVIHGEKDLPCKSWINSDII